MGVFDPVGLGAADVFETSGDRPQYIAGTIGFADPGWEVPGFEPEIVAKKNPALRTFPSR